MTSPRRRDARRFASLLFCASLLTVGSRVVRAGMPLPSSPYAWQNVQIVGGGFVDGLQFHPGQKGLAYARTDVGGAYRWDVRAERWVAITDGFGFEQWNYTGIESLAIDPTDPQHRFGGVNALAANPRVYGRVYIGTSGRGIVEGNMAASDR